MIKKYMIINGLLLSVALCNNSYASSISNDSSFDTIKLPSRKAGQPKLVWPEFDGESRKNFLAECESVEKEGMQNLYDMFGKENVERDDAVTYTPGAILHIIPREK